MAAKKAAKKKHAKKATPRMGGARTPAEIAAPEPSQERRELERAIMQQFAMESIPLEESIAHRPSDIAVIW
jgi:hypothetical protein